jgi:hypothetical protein
MAATRRADIFQIAQPRLPAEPVNDISSRPLILSSRMRGPDRIFSSLLPDDSPAS